jgi:hypothetical protein
VPKLRNDHAGDNSDRDIRTCAGCSTDTSINPVSNGEANILVLDGSDGSRFRGVPCAVRVAISRLSE